MFGDQRGVLGGKGGNNSVFQGPTLSIINTPMLNLLELALLGCKILLNITFYLHKLDVYSQNQPTFSTPARKYSIKLCNLLLFGENVEILGSSLGTTA